MLRLVSFSILAAVGIATLSASAQADHRWRRSHTYFPLIDVFPGGWDDEDDYASLYDDESEDVPDHYLPRKKRASRAEEPWWLYEDDESLEPVVKTPAKKKVKKPATASAPMPPKPVAKPKELTASAAAPVKPVVPKAAPAAKVEPKPSTALASVPEKPAPASKDIGCAAGAAVVTGYGFGDVKPKTCTGDTYAYTASRGGKAFIITLTASTGEVVDVKKL